MSRVGGGRGAGDAHADLAAADALETTGGA
jgi:hypothetical protein